MKGVTAFAATRFRLGGIALLILAFACVAAPAQAADVTITSPEVTEGDSGTSDAIFTVTLTSQEGAEVTLDYQTFPGLPADPQDDFLPRSGQITFAVGETTKTIPVPIVGDTADEPTEYFDLQLTGAGLAEAVTGTATIIDDDATLTISDVSVVETNAGTTNANFTVSVSNTDSGQITVSYATADGSATFPADYTATSGTLTFAEFGELTQTISVPVVGDTTDESDETFFVNLSNPSSNVSIADAQGQGTILDDEGVVPPDATIDDVSITEGDSGTASATFTVTLSGAALGTATIDFSTADGTARQPGDYTLASGTLTFAGGDRTETITVPVVGDTVDEADETFVVNLTNASANVAIADAQGQGTIRDDDAPTTYVRPKVASPVSVPLVPAFVACGTSNRNHGPPLGSRSCYPPTPVSQYLTVGTPDANGASAKFAGSMRFTVVAGNPSTPGDQADMRLNVNLTDVRNKSDLSDYGGQLQASVGARITDRQNGSSLTESATVQDFAFSFTFLCTTNTDSTVGSTCGAATTADAVIPNSIQEGKRTIWGLGQTRVFDGGDDGFVSTGDNTVFAKQGIFVP